MIKSTDEWPPLPPLVITVTPYAEFVEVQEPFPLWTKFSAGLIQIAEPRYLYVTLQMGENGVSEPCEVVIPLSLNRRLRYELVAYHQMTDLFLGRLQV